MVGLVLGLSLQFVRAWTEPSAAPPDGNLGAPINTGPIGQFKQGVLQVLGLTVFNDPDLSGVDVKGMVLTAQNANGAVGWESGGGSCYTDYSMDSGKSSSDTCTISGFTVKGDLGSWGYCLASPGNLYAGGFYPPGGETKCKTTKGFDSSPWVSGEAYLCCQ